MPVLPDRNMAENQYTRIQMDAGILGEIVRGKTIGTGMSAACLLTGLPRHILGISKKDRPMWDGLFK